MSVMTLPSLLLAVTLKPLLFSAQPIPAEMARGAQAYYRRQGIERVLREDRVVIGTWFDGRIKRDVQDVIWLSPSLVSRWLGYLNAKEKWSSEELLGRWQAAARALNGKLTFIVQLSALPRQDPLELGADAPARFEDALEARFLVTHAGRQASGLSNQHLESLVSNKALVRYEPLVSTLGVFRAYDWRKLFEPKWYQLDRDFWPLTPEFETGLSRDPYRYKLGDHVTAIYRVEAQLPDSPIDASEIQLRVFTRRHELVARFSLRNPSPVQ
jgi:hypothetical protein